MASELANRTIIDHWVDGMNTWSHQVKLATILQIYFQTHFQRVELLQQQHVIHKSKKSKEVYKHVMHKRLINKLNSPNKKKVKLTETKQRINEHFLD